MNFGQLFWLIMVLINLTENNHQVFNILSPNPNLIKLSLYIIFCPSEVRGIS